MTARDIKVEDWWCIKHQREKEMVVRDGVYQMVCHSCDAEHIKESRDGTEPKHLCATAL